MAITLGKPKITYKGNFKLGNLSSYKANFVLNETTRTEEFSMFKVMRTPFKIKP